MPMGAGKAFAVAQTKLGIAIETTRGVAEVPAFWIPVRSPKYKVDQTEIPDETLQGSMVKTYGLVTGLRYDGHGWDSYPYLDTLPVLVRCELGSPDTLIAKTTTSKLLTAAAKGTSTIKVTKKPTVGSFLVIGAGGTLESQKVRSVSGTATPFIITLTTGLLYAHAKTAVVKSLTGHKFSLLNNAGTGNQPPSCTITDYDGDMWRQLTAAQLDDFTLKGNVTGLLDYTCSWFANPAVKLTSPPSTSFSTVRPTPSWSTTVKLGGSGTTPLALTSWTVAMKRGVKPTPALTGSREYYNYFANPLTPTGKLTIIEKATSPYLTDYENGVQQSIDLVTFDITSGFVLEIHSSQSKFKSGSIERSKEQVEVPLDFEMLPSATDATAGGKSPVVVTIWNSRTTTY